MYNKFSDDDLVEAYSTMIDYSGKPTSEILEEIENRGGLEKFLELIKQKEVNKKESDRVLNLIIDLNREGLGLDEIKNNITSEIWTKQHLNAFIESRYIRHQLYLHDKSIDREVIFGSFLGTFIASITGSALWAFSIIFLKFVFYPILVCIYFVSYFIIRGLARKSHNNGIVFIASLTATIISFALGFIILGKI